MSIDCTNRLPAAGLQPGFLAEYLDASASGWERPRDPRGSGILWTLPTAEQAVREVFDYGLTEEREHQTKRFYPNLFTRIPEPAVERAYDFLCRYTKDNSANIAKVNVVLQCIREGLPDRWKPFVLYLVSIQLDPGFFGASSLDKG